jgi:hypothetical protein
VHRSLGEQHQDGRTDVTSTTSPSVTAAAAAGAETGTEATWPETEARAKTTGTESASEATAEGTVMAGLGPYRLAECATGLLALLVQGPAVVGRETEVRWSAGERAAYLGPACFKEWVVH